MPRRSSRKRTAADDPDPPQDESANANKSRRSSRSTKFASSLKEPDHSIKDLLGGMSERIPVTKKKKVSKSKSETEAEVSESEVEVDSDSDCGSDSYSEDERPARRSTRTKVRAVSTPPARANKARGKKMKAVKSPAVRHSKARKKIKLEKMVESDLEDDTDDTSDASSVETDDQPEIKIQRIIAARMETKKKWVEICSKINTSEIDDGSRWFQEMPGKRDEDKFEERFLIKWADLSFLHCSWEKKEDLIDQVDGAKTYLNTFFRKSQNGFFYDADERMDGEYYDPSFVQIERILEVNPPDGWENKKSSKKGKKKNEWGIIHDVEHSDYENGTGRSFLVTWGNTPYSDATYEYERDLIMMETEYESHLQHYLDRSTKPNKTAMKKVLVSREEEKRRLYKVFGDRVKDGEMKETNINTFTKGLEEFEFPNGGRLRDYQAEGVSWLLANHVNSRSAILADEMGLGKTIQTAVYVEMIATRLKGRGPFLIVAPLSTIPHWQREFTGWTALNTIVYHGSQKDREVIREFEFAFECDRPQGGLGINQRYLNKCHTRKSTKAERIWMAQVVITTPEMLVTDDFNELTAVKWDLLVVDEAHRLKSHSSKLAVNLRDSRFVFHHTLLLTGTPIQNNMNELWALMNVVDPDKFSDCDEFMEKYDNMQSKERVDELHELIRPYILRRLKEDVEKSVPPKEETLIEVELTLLQKQYYRALYEKNVKFLHRDVKRALDGPSLNNLSMQLRKCCNHPFLLEGVELKAKKGVKLESNRDEADFLAKASGKLVLLDKLLPKLQDGGHRVLIFSQFKIMLDIIEDYLSLRAFKHERIDGSITGKKRQNAIDRFQSKESAVPPFVMLLSTRAGGVGINLTAADTCIIFDSDWNPQNDLQAQARCHRIGQTKSVKIYRLLTRKTYEMQMFHMSSLKMGLDQAVLQGIENGGAGNNGHNMTKDEVEKLLRHGAYDMFQEEQEGTAEKESSDFEEQDIDTILERRSKTVIHENTGSNSNAAGGTFSKASFRGSESASSQGAANKDVDIDDPDFWVKMVGEVKAEDTSILLSDKKRSRNTKVVYDESLIHQGFEGDSDTSSAASGEGSDDSFELESNFEEFNFSAQLKNEHLNHMMQKRKNEIECSERHRWGGKGSSEWTIPDVDILVKLLRRYGYPNPGRQRDLIIEKFKSKSIKGYGHDDQGEERSNSLYADEEILRMCWSLCLIALQEVAQENVIEVARRAQRDANKKNEASPSLANVVAQNADTKSVDPFTITEEWKKKQEIISFQKYRNSSIWAKSALLDAFEYAKGKVPRDPKQLVIEEPGEEKVRPLQEAFNENILPALTNRGWKEQNAKSKKPSLTDTHGKTYHSIAEVLDCLPIVHPELEGSVNSIISSIANSFYSENQEQPETDSLANFDADKMTQEQLALFLRAYSPCQITIDRLVSKRINLVPQRLTSTLSYVHNAHTLVGKVFSSDHGPEDATEKYLQISRLIDISPKAALPHRHWKPVHDAILVFAIAKHGWIDRDSHCSAIIEDKGIKWGPPFEKASSGEPASRSNENTKENAKNMDLLQNVAKRATDFLNNEQESLEGCKGLNLNLILKTYSIISSKHDDDDNNPEKWQVDFEELQNSSVEDKNSSDDSEIELAELPTRKELLRRARILLTRQHSNSNSDVAKTQTTFHNYSVLDQSNPCNTFLAELLREAIKVGQKQQLWIDKLLAIAHAEAEARSQECLTTPDESAELSKISKHIIVVRQHSKPLVRPAKNVLRAILGLEVHQQNKANESLFVKEKVVSAISKKSKRSKSNTKTNTNKEKKKPRSIESTAGDAAVNKALSIGKHAERNMVIPKENYLKLTSIETLMLSVLCSQGMPICDDQWRSALDIDGADEDSYFLCWSQTGSVLEAAAETWYSMTATRLANARKNGEVPQALQLELEGRQLVYTEAANLRKNPTSLAKKAIMLIQAVRTSTGNRLKGASKKEISIGLRTLQWSSNHLMKWSQSLGIFIGGKVLCNTVIATRPDVIPTAYIDEKGCAAIYSQIVQQSRLRALYLKYDEDDFFGNMLQKALRYCDSTENEWEARPSWWGDDDNSPAADDESLICGILQFGYGGFDEMVRQDERFSEHDDCSSYEKFDRWSAQKRLDCITRELGAIDDTAESIRLLNERKHNSVINGKGAENKISVQVGIDAFFVPKKGKGAPDENSDDSSIEIIETSPGKRKGTLVENAVGKKTKS